MKPTKITGPPTRRCGKHGGNALLYPCDNGSTYTQSELAEAIGMSPGGLGLRLRKYGWDHPDILSKSCRGKTFSGEIIGADKGGNEQWEGMSNKPRTHNLHKIGIGALER